MINTIPIIDPQFHLYVKDVGEGRSMMKLFKAMVNGLKCLKFFFIKILTLDF